MRRATRICLVLSAAACGACLGPRGETLVASSRPDGRAALTLEQVQPVVQLPPPVETAAPPSPATVRSVQTARERFDAELWSEAISAAQKALQASPESAEAHYLIARAALQQGNAALARTHLETALSMVPRDAALYAMRGAIAWQEDRCDAVIEAGRMALLCEQLQHAGESSPPVVLMRAYLGLCLAKEGYDRAARDMLEQYVSLTAAPTAAMKDHIELKTAMVLLRDRIHATLGELYERCGDLPHAVEAYERAAKAKPDDAALAARWARLLARSGRSEDALQTARRVALQASGDEGIDLLEEICRLIGKPAQVNSELAQLAERSGPEQAIRLARRLTTRGKADAAAALLSRAAANRGSNVDVRYALAELHAEAGRYDQFLAALTDAIRAAPSEYQRTLGVLERVAAQPQPRAALVRLCDHTPGKSDVVRSVLEARIRVIDGKAELAGEVVEKAVQAARESGAGLGAEAGPACVVLAEHRLAKHRWDDAIAICREAEKSGFRHAGLQVVMARGLEAQDDFDGAEGAYREAIRLAPKDAGPRTNLAELQSRRGDPKRAMATYAAILEEADPKNLDANESLFRTMLAAGQMDRAAALVKEMKRFGADAPSTLRCDARLKAVARAGSQQQRLDGYRQALQGIRDQHPGDVRTLFDQAEAAAAAAELEAALRYINEVLAIDPDHLAAREQRVALLAGMLRQDEAHQELLRMVAERPRSSAWRRLLIGLAMDRVDDETAVAQLKEALVRTELSAEQKLEYQTQLLEVLDATGRRDEAIAMARSMYEAEPQRRSNRAIYLAVLERAKQYATALDLVEKSLRTDPTRFELRAEYVTRLVRADHVVRAMQEVLAWLEDEPEDLRLAGLLLDVLRESGEFEQLLMLVRALGGGEGVSSYDLLNAYLRTKRYDEAMDLMRALFRSPRPEDEGSFDSTLLNVAQQAGRLDEAERLLTGALEPILAERRDGKPVNVARMISLMQTLASVYQRTGRPERGEALLKDAFEAVPNEIGLNNDLGYTWADAGKNVDQALKMIRYAVARAPREAAYLDSLGWVEYKRGRFEDAAEWLRRARRWRKSDPTLLDHAGDTAFRLGRIDEARQHWGRAVEMVRDPKRTPDPEEDAVARRAESKLAAVRGGRMPEVAAIAKRAASRPAGADPPSRPDRNP